jgi:hypothetical protein
MKKNIHVKDLRMGDWLCANNGGHYCPDSVDVVWGGALRYSDA